MRQRQAHRLAHELGLDHDHLHEEGTSHEHGHGHHHPNSKAVSNRLARAIGHLEAVNGW